MDDALTLSIEQLSNLWLVKYRDAWVDFEEQEEFYQIAATRLVHMGKMEKHHVNNITVYRIVE